MERALPLPKHPSQPAHPTTHNRSEWKLDWMVRLVNCLLSGIAVFRFAGVGIDRLTVRTAWSMQRSQCREVFA
jgi:hypothetical protein